MIRAIIRKSQGETGGGDQLRFLRGPGDGDGRWVGVGEAEEAGV